MDSGNSSSMQSSSGGGDDEYDSVSRPESVPVFFSSSGHFHPLSNQHPSLVVHHQDQPFTFFDPSANYLNNPFSLSPTNNSLLNFDGVRPRMSLRSEPNTIDLGHLSSQSILGSHCLNQGPFPGSSLVQPRSVHENGVRTSTQSDQTTSAVKNPKKRTRASRRAPTTVLSTDTTNFRAMVQEFTGIPAPPFAGSSYSRRLDLFISGSASRFSHLEPLGSSLYPIRPSAKRVQTTPFASSSSPSLLNDPLLAAANTSTTTIANAFNPSSSNYQIPSDVGLLKQPHISNFQNQSQTLLLQSFLDPPPPLHPSLGLPGFGVKSQGSSAIDELGFRHGNASLGSLQNHLTPEAERSRNERNWSDHGVRLNDGLENVSSRAEGTVGSWICPAE
ncbi:Tetratricopeptide repeat-containing protein, putative isoform 1 [Hibiscus syriacus]|uniref:Tetratricopeptide repeat-containing protein, putative isoform 1 n=1 Tax=Hibiscus syriacus TaxID=106335 RepID=A0A6A2WCW6_HIBSY|nr:uncharacterized protein LOC120195209 [Hibiscus syriacus]KAE8656092.1 Tetratricopeptide repeat-containing protein, putative isoform 1 [Hibiscus syriacus]